MSEAEAIETDSQEVQNPYAQPGAQLKRIREERDLTREQVQLATNVNASSLSQYESGATRPSDQNWARLFALFGDGMPEFGLGGTDMLRELAEKHVQVGSTEPPEEAQELRAIRKFTGHSLAATAEAVSEVCEEDVNANTVRCWEVGTKTPEPEHVEAMREVFGIDTVPTFGHDV